MKHTDTQLKQLHDYVGGESNIISVTHCVTRLRFVLKDESIVNKDKIKEFKFVKGCLHNGGQFQVVIGPEVEKVYKKFIDVNKMNPNHKSASKNDSSKKNLFQRLLGSLAEIFIPLLPAIIAGGLILGFRNIIGDIQFGGATLASKSVFWNGVYQFLWLPAQAIFHFLPVGITWSVSKKMGTSQILGIVLGLTLISPQLLPPAQLATGELLYWDFGFVQLARVGYQSQVIPAVLAALTMSYMEIGLKKVIPSVISMIFVPFITLLTSVILAHAFIGPVGRFIGDGIGNMVGSAITGPYSIIFAFLFGLLYAPIVITGVHYVFNAVNLQLIATLGATPLFPLVALSNIAQASSSLAIAVMNKNTEEREISIPSTISGYLGVTEPAMYGVNLRYKFPFYCSMIGAACACAVANAFGTMANSIGVGGLPAILSIQPQYWLIFTGAMVVAIIVPFFLTAAVYKKKELSGELEFTEVLNS
ncbi:MULTISPECIES: PTS trehalose transporter subunit IIBC [unclassified Clostridioides]|uniref:PTS trehalose transporter subunit IIBC n=1 Tax=unclassified Clostridioides TaxID=2635829 RepID=UPI001D113CB8|nr:PTS trehalose transporter subunit IIBC [Clostridioides sp. ZZV14-6150]MCC0721381.1 PTS trehalose transporter subunit IIBC [Clostridioides sp. ZZV14-6104]MCC0725573.1 PTS trehalose transporter subunit IIBC [Clostridioides sp. ZZV14-6045]MCC0742009.1 PTS trehalose transporter subunit IIBC [Clostridioides sp. ZZV14-6044]MCC0749652.1 PTS trehalose transporter subunit IIBC [Clostridioides sp. ZZV13-5731]WLD29179.1 PTS system trehalose-specific EIIBC component [Clostridioides difficile]